MPQVLWIVKVILDLIFSVMIISILLTILKIILCILLALVVIILLLLVIPFRYEIYFENERGGKASGRGQFSDFLKFFRLSYEEFEGEYDVGFTLFWGLLRILPKKKDKSTQDEPEEDFSAEGILDDEDILDILEETYVPPQSEEKAKTIKIEQTSHVEEEQSPKKKKEKKPSKKKTSPKQDRLQSLGQIFNEQNMQVFTFLVNKVIWLIKKIRPRILEADFSFSLGEPDTTGIATGVISLCPVVYGKKVNIEPDFDSDEPYFDGKVDIKGFVFLMHIVYLIISVLLNRDFRNLLKQ